MYKDGTASDNVYLVTYDEITWSRVDDDQRDEFTALWELETKKHKCRYLAVRVMPDALFGEGKPRVVIQRDFDPAPWKVTVSVELALHPDTDYAVNRERMLRRVLHAYGAGTKYKVTSEYAGIVEEGVL